MTMKRKISLFEELFFRSTGLHASPPCETYTDARWLPAPEGRSKPRPLRDYSFLWGFEALDFSELRQLRVGNVLFLLVRLECLVGFLKSASTFRGPFDELGGVDTSTGEWKTARPKRSLRLKYAQVVLLRVGQD